MFPRDMVCLKNISVDILHKGDTEYNDNNNNNFMWVEIWDINKPISGGICLVQTSLQFRYLSSERTPGSCYVRVMYSETYSLIFCELKNWSSEGLPGVASSPSTSLLKLRNGYSTEEVPLLRRKIKNLTACRRFSLKLLFAQSFSLLRLYVLIRYLQNSLLDNIQFTPTRFIHLNSKPILSGGCCNK
jgi:hypothetical protein